MLISGSAWVKKCISGLIKFEKGPSFLRFIQGRTEGLFSNAIVLTSATVAGFVNSIFLVNSHTFNRLISQNLETPALQNIHPRWSLIAFHLFSSKPSLSAVSVKKTTRPRISFSFSYKENPLNHNIGLTVSYSVLGVQDAWFLKRSDAGVHQLQACRQLLLYVLLSIYMSTNRIGKQKKIWNKDTASSAHLLVI